MTDLTQPVIAIVGAGAVGGYYGARLAQHGFDVHFLLRSEYEAVLRNGWTVRSCDGDFVIPPDKVRAYDDPRRMPKADLVIVALKTVSNDAFEALVRPLLKEGTAILTLQNGLGNEDQLAGLFGGGRVLGGMAFVCINRTGPGVLHHIDHGFVRLGEYVGGSGARAERIAAMFRASKVKCEVLPDLKVGRWQKLVWNATFNGLGAVTDLTTDRLIGTGPGMELVAGLINEVIETARAVGVVLPPETLDVQIRHTATMGAYKSSMQVDRQAGRPMEVEAILGEPLRVARRAGVKTPILEMVYRLAKAVDAARPGGA